MTPSCALRIELWNSEIDADLDGLARLLEACVHAGASVSFVLPFSHEDARAFWREQVLPGAQTGSRRVLLARLDGRIAGTVQLDLGTPPNQPHRAEVRKLLVHPEVRRRGIAAALMDAIEEQARDAGRTLLTLDTVTGGAAERLYRALGYTAIGAIPGFAWNFDSSKLESTTIFYKQLAAESAG